MSPPSLTLLLIQGGPTTPARIISINDVDRCHYHLSNNLALQRISYWWRILKLSVILSFLLRVQARFLNSPLVSMGEELLSW
jgi:hypothetical protein